MLYFLHRKPPMYRPGVWQRWRLPHLESLEDRRLLSNLPFSYTTLDVPGRYNTEPAGINDAGQVVGEYSDDINGYVLHGFLLSGGSYTTIDYPGAIDTVANGINDAGQVVGYYSFSAGSTIDFRGFLLSGGKYTTIGVPGANDVVVAGGINDSGQIVGYFDDASYVYHGFILSGGSYTTIDFPGEIDTSAGGINDSGQVLGGYNNGSKGDVQIGGSFILSGGSYITIDFPGADDQSATGINDTGQVVGYYFEALHSHGYLLSGGGYTTIDYPGANETGVSGINDTGQVVGYYHDAGGFHGFLAAAALPDIAATTPSFDKTTGGVDFGYTISNGSLPQATTIDLDWASGTTADTVIGSPISSTTTQTAQGTYDLHPTLAQLGTSPPGAKDLLVVADPNNLVSPAEPRKVAALALSVIAPMTPSFNTADGGVDYGYSISGNDLPQATTVDLDWASGVTATTVIGAPIVRTTTMTAQGTYKLHATAGQLGTPPAGAKYLLVVADPDNVIFPADRSKVAALALPDIAAVSVRYSPFEKGREDGLAFQYDVEGTTPSPETTIAFRWATGPSTADEIQGVAPLIYQVNTNALEAVGSHDGQIDYETYASFLDTQPAQATDLVMVVNPAKTVILSDASDDVAFAKIIPLVVNVATHGFGNDSVLFNNFLDTWNAMGDALDNTIPNGSVLEGKVKTYVADWDSSAGWVPAAFSDLVATFYDATGSPTLAAIARTVAQFEMNTASNIAVQEANTIVTSLIGNGWIDPEATVNGEQFINLIGHSRGAAVNAMVASELAQAGFRIDQYTALDGYSTDWPGVSKELGDISIVDQINSIPSNLIGRKVNYRVQLGLQSYFPDVLQPYLEALGSEFLGLSTGTIFSSAFLGIIGAALPDWRAPARSGFENITVAEPIPYALTNHLNVTQVYLGSLSAPIQYILDNFEGAYSQLNNGVTSPGPDPNVLSNDQVLGPDVAPTLADQTLTPAATAPDTTSTSMVGSFLDGSFEMIGAVQQELSNTPVGQVQDPAVQAWRASVDDPAGLIATLWETAGDVQLVRDQGNALAQLSLHNGTASIGQHLELDSSASTISFDLSLLSTSPGDQLQVLFNNNVLGTFNLSDLAASGHYTVPLTAYVSHDGEATFQLVGPAGDSSKIALDNLSVNEATNLVSVSGSATYGGTAALTATLTSGGAPLAGKTISFTLNEGSVTPVGTATTDASGAATLTGVSVASLNAGTFTDALGASFLGDSNYSGSGASGDLTVSPAQAILSLSGLMITYDGTPKTATVSTAPAALDGVALTYTLHNSAVAAPTQAGSYLVTATLNNPNYVAANVTGTLVISPATPTIAWANPADISYGTALGGAQLDATASVAGTFVYTPAAGTFLNAGQSQLLRATFIPGDPANVNEVTSKALIDVLPTPLTVTAADASIVAGESSPRFTARYDGFVRGEGPGVLSGLLTFSVPAGATSQAGQYPITPGGLSSSNYAITYATGTLNVVPQPLPLVTVRSVQWQTQKQGRKKTVKVLVVDYSNALNPVDAQDVGAYHLIAAGRDQQFGTRDDKTIPLAAAAYNSAAHTVTLTPRGKVANQSLRLTINASVVLDPQGRPLDGNRDGQPGGDFQSIFGSGGISLSSVSRTGLSSRLSVNALDSIPLIGRTQWPRRARGWF